MQSASPRRAKIQEELLPSRIDSLRDREIHDIIAGDSHSLAIDSTGALYSWGRNREGQLGLGSTRIVNTPHVVESLVHERIASGAAGTYHSLVVTQAGDLYSFGAHYKEDTSSAVYFGTGNLPAHKRAMIEQSHLSYLRANTIGSSSSSDTEQNDEPSQEAAPPPPRGGGGAASCDGSSFCSVSLLLDDPMVFARR
mmetsp:Transcript_37180/g.77755  ORF Transcript_37180/g.77755 Transcript_37180/m.77755 type:complete len:196 (+) Transcript_37180:1-588(+)